MSLLEVLGSSQRIEILRELTDGPMYVSELADTVGMDGKSAAHHLSVLEDAGLLRYYYDGNRKYYRLVRELKLEATPPPERSFVLRTADPPAAADAEWPESSSD